MQRRRIPASANQPQRAAQPYRSNIPFHAPSSHKIPHQRQQPIIAQRFSRPHSNSPNLLSPSQSRLLNHPSIIYQAQQFPRRRTCRCRTCPSCRECSECLRCCSSITAAEMCDMFCLVCDAGCRVCVCVCQTIQVCSTCLELCCICCNAATS